MATTKRGRPTEYHKDIAEEICNVIAANSKGIKRLCKENEHWPNQDTIFIWLKKHSEFSEQYARAKKCQIDCLVDEILEIADDTTHDLIENPAGYLVANAQAVNRARLKIDTRKWLASKLVPKIYGLKPEECSMQDEKFLKELKERREQLDLQYQKEY